MAPLVLAGAITPGSHAAARHEAGHAYAAGVRHAIDAYWYDTAVPRPALLILHGGHWSSGGRGEWAGTARYFADHGFAVFAADYRYGADAAWPAPRDDAFAALGWIRAHASRFHADPAHVVVLGSQAGGQLATALATYGAGRARIDAAAGLSPIASPYRAWAQAPTSAATAIRREIRDEAVVLHRCHPDVRDLPCWARWTDSAARSHATGPDDAPMLLVHSAADPVPAAHSYALRDAEIARGAAPADVTVRTVPGGGSGGALLTGPVRAQVLGWLRARTRTARPPMPSPVPPVPRAAHGPAARRPIEDGPVPPPPAGSLRRAGGTPVAGTYAYGPDPAQRLDAYFVPGLARPALVIVHGGYWYEEDKYGWATTARWYARHGFAVFAVDYRLDDRAGWTAQRTDVLSAVAWIRAHAAAVGADPYRIMLLGSSSGGQIAAAAGTYGAGGRLVRGVVALSPVASPYRAYVDGQRPGAGASQWKLRDNATLLARCSPERSDRSCRHRWSDAVVKNHASEGDAPMFLLHSQDDFVPAAHSAALCAALRAARVDCALGVVPGHGHGSALLRTPGVHTAILAWLRAHEGLPRSPRP
jgi:acetyl esterase/lipase